MIIKNAPDSVKSNKQRYSFFTPLELKTLNHCAVDMPLLNPFHKNAIMRHLVDERQNEDYVSLHAIQIKGLQCTERSRREVYQKNSELLKDWEESFLRGKNPDKDPDSQIEDISNLKLMSKMEYFSSTQLYFRKSFKWMLLSDWPSRSFI